MPLPGDASRPGSTDLPRKSGLPSMACALRERIRNRGIESTWPFDPLDSKLDHSKCWHSVACTKRILCDENCPQQYDVALGMNEKGIDQSRIE